MKRMGLLLGTMLLFSTAAWAQETRFPVRQHHFLRSNSGELIITERGVEFRAKDEKRARTWKYTDIQQIGLLSSKELSILTYEDNKWKLGKDRLYRFEITSGEMTPSLWNTLQSRLARPVVSTLIPAEVRPRFTIPAKHVRGFGGTQGTLEFGDEYVIYRTDAPKDSRVWRYRDISSIGTTGPYQLRITSMERVEGEFAGERNFVFALKERLTPEAYDFVWWKISGAQISPSRR